MAEISVQPLGDMALVVEVGDELSFDVNASVRALDAALIDLGVPGVLETVPALASLLVRFDPLVVDADELTAQIATLVGADPRPAEPRRWTIPAGYGGEAGPDLGSVADALGVTEHAATEAHAAMEHTVLMLGFAPGLAYLGVMPETWGLPRLDSVKASVPAGSISVAVRQTVFCATPIPTGWRTIARSPFLTFRPAETEPFLLRPGDIISFDPVSPAELRRLDGAAAAGTFRPHHTR